MNQREDEILIEINKLYDDLFCTEDIIKESEKLPNKINMSLEKAKLIDDDWEDDSELSSKINNCINIENNINNISLINDEIKKYKSNSDKDIIQYELEEESIKNIIKTIKSIGKLNINSMIDSLIIKNEKNLYKLENLIIKRNLKEKLYIDLLKME